MKKFCHEFKKGQCPFCNAGVPRKTIVALTLTDAITRQEFIWQGTEEQYEKIFTYKKEIECKEEK